MIATFSQRLGAALIGLALLSSCSRPVAYFQRGPVDPSVTYKTQLIAVTTPEPVVTISTGSLAQVSETTVVSEAFVRADDKLATHKKLTKRMDRVQHLLASTSKTFGASHTSQKLNGVQRLILKKLNKRISRQLAPSQPEKAMLNAPKVIIGGVLLVGGLVMLIAGTGTVAFVGLIVALVGALGVLVGLLGIDS